MPRGAAWAPGYAASPGSNPWLGAIATGWGHATNRRRTQAVRVAGPAPLVSGEPDAWSALPAEDRRAIGLAYFDGLSAVEMAGHLGQSARMVRATVVHGLRQLRDSPTRLVAEQAARAADGGVAARQIAPRDGRYSE